MVGEEAVSRFVGTGAARRESVRTLANLITVVRTIIGIGFGVVALAEQSMGWLIAAYLSYWIGDIADGLVARARGEEPVIGAVFDVVCDRACTTVAAAAFVVIEPRVALAMGIFLVQFCMLDTMLTLSFLYFPHVISPNYFYLVDRPTYRWNWSLVAKAANTSFVVLLCLIGQFWAAVAWGVAMLAVKVVSVHRVLGILAGTRPAAPRPAQARASALFG